MAGNSFGTLFRITTFGESHGIGIGVVIDGCPAGLVFDEIFIQSKLDSRRPGQSKITTQRKESDIFQCLSGVYNGKTLGSPITLFIPNEDSKSSDYDEIEFKFRPSHADFVYHEKYGIKDHRGGGRSSARETAARVAAGAVAQLLLAQLDIQVYSYVNQVGLIKIDANSKSFDLSKIYSNDIRCPDQDIAIKMSELISSVQKDGDTIGGTIFTEIKNCPVGLGDPVFDKLHADLGKAILSINACKGIDFGSGFDSLGMRGSEHNDQFHKINNTIQTITNNSGGIQGGISNGNDIRFCAVFKPVSTILTEQKTVDVNGNEVDLTVKGRHDPCVLPRAVPIVEAMTALVIVDHYLRNKISKL